VPALSGHDKRKNSGKNQKERNGSMKRLCLVSITLVALVGASAAPDQRKCNTYDYSDTGKEFRLVIPEGLPLVRGILVVGPYSGGDSRDYHQQVWYREFLHLHGFAFLGAKGFYLAEYKTMQDALQQFATDSKHPELVNAPYAATGFSAGGGFVRRLLMLDPDKVIAGVIVGSTLKLNATPTASHLGTPVCVINGELEHEQGEAPGMAKALAPMLAAHRPKGALWGWMAAPGVGHEFKGQEVLSMPILDAAVRLRYPATGDVRTGPLKLQPVDPGSGWVADNNTWSNAMTKIAAAPDFNGDITQSSWLLNQDIAFIYRAYSTLDRLLKITSPHPMSAQSELWDPGSSVVVKIDDTKFTGWKKLELYDGAQKVGELSEGPARFTVKDLKPGYHVFSVLGMDANGNLRPSNPVMVVVRKLAAHAGIGHRTN
jgi:hypothetical protein